MATSIHQSTRGIIAVYKPKGPTSHDIIYQLRRLTGEKRIGHAGTLDPLASGVLVVGIGREATRKLSTQVSKEKEYKALIQLDAFSSTDDQEGEKTLVDVQDIPTAESVQSVLDSFVGKTMQMPPKFSALKIKGQTAYSLARKGKEVVLEPRQVLIKEVEMLTYTWPQLEIRVVTGPGVYIRSLARDIGTKLGSGGYLAELERIRVGEFTKETAVQLP